MVDSRSRRLRLLRAPETLRSTAAEPDPVAEPGLDGAVTFGTRRGGRVAVDDERSLFLDTLAEYVWARDVAGLSAGTLDRLTQPVIEVCEHYGAVPWRLTPRQVDLYFVGPGKRSRETVRKKMTVLDGYFAFLEQRYAGEIARRFEVSVESPIDSFNRPRHRGDFGLRIPPSQRATREFFATWRAALADARKPTIACRDYVMAKLTYISGVRAAELCAVKIGDVHWESGQWGRFLVDGKGARGSGPRQREAYLFADGRELLWWYIEEIRGEFPDDADDPIAPLFPSERIPAAFSRVGRAAPCGFATPSAFRRALKQASRLYLTGPVRELHPHLLRHACATHNYERGMSLWEVQQLLGHDRATTTVQYLSTAHADPELANLAASERAVQRLVMDKGNLR